MTMRDPPVAPVLQARGKLRAFRLGQHEIAHGELTDLADLKGAAEILRSRLPLDPAFADQNIGVARFSSGSIAIAKMILPDVIADRSRSDRRPRRARISTFCRLRTDVCVSTIEFPERFDVVAEEFSPNRQLRLPGKKIENSTADGELSARRDLRDAFVTGFAERFDRTLHGFARATPQRNDRRAAARPVRRRLIKARASRDDDVRSLFALNSAEQGEPFRGDLLVGQNVFNRREFGFRQERARPAASSVGFRRAVPASGHSDR